MSVDGVVKCGYPGVCVVEGEARACDEFVRRLRGLGWSAMSVRAAEDDDEEFVDDGEDGEGAASRRGIATRVERDWRGRGDERARGGAEARELGAAHERGAAAERVTIGIPSNIINHPRLSKCSFVNVPRLWASSRAWPPDRPTPPPRYRPRRSTPVRPRTPPRRPRQKPPPPRRHPTILSLLPNASPRTKTRSEAATPVNSAHLAL